MRRLWPTGTAKGFAFVALNTTAHVARMTHQAIPDAQLSLVPKAGHLSHLDQPEKCNRRVLEFLQGIAANMVYNTCTVNPLYIGSRNVRKESDHGTRRYEN